ncbi:MAG: HNH endonuclease signature motif containing protein [Candidatus Cybelea sp.]
MPRRFYDWKAVQAYHDEGQRFAESAAQFGFTKSGWNKAVARGKLQVSACEDRRRRYDWSAVQSYYEAGASFRQCKKTFGFSNTAWLKAVQRGELKPRNSIKSISEVLASGSSRWLKKAQLIREGVLERRCTECGISEWRNKPLVIQIDHINGIKNDWHLENLRMLCPNCHSQTETFGGRNVKRAGLARRRAAPVV